MNEELRTVYPKFDLGRVAHRPHFNGASVKVYATIDRMDGSFCRSVRIERLTETLRARWDVEFGHRNVSTFTT